MSLLLICTMLCVLHITTVTASTNATKIGFHKSCNLGKLGDQYQVDKMDRCHRYQQFYCDLLLPYRKHHFSLLEIGMGCGHHTSCPKSPIMWKTFLPHVEYYGIDFLKDPKKTPEDCIARLKREYPDIPTEGRMFFGSQRDNVFLDQVLKATNIKFDVIIDDASHDADDETNSFIKLWPYVAEGGLFIIEDLQVGRKGKVIFIVNFSIVCVCFFSDLLVHCRLSEMGRKLVISTRWWVSNRQNRP